MNRIIASVLILCVALVAFETRAAEWRFEPSVSVAGEYDDNADLSVLTSEEQEINGLVVDASMRFGYTSPVTSFYALPRVRSRQYGEDDFDANDGFLRFGMNRTFRSARFRLRGTYDSELARTAERADVSQLDIDDPETAPTDDSSRVFVRGRRDRFELAPGVTFDLSPKSSLGIDLVHTDTGYDEDLFPLLNDYRNTRASISWRNRWSATNTAVLALTARNFSSDCPVCDEDVNGFGLRGGFERRLSETTRFNAIVGVESTQLPGGEDNVSPTANITLTRRLETITLFAQYRRDVTGGGGGALVARDTVNLNFDRKLNDYFSAGLGVRGYVTSTLEEGQFNVDERSYVQLRAMLEWRLSETFSVEANYRYTVLSREVLGEASNSNNVMLWLNWRPVPSVRSR